MRLQSVHNVHKKYFTLVLLILFTPQVHFSTNSTTVIDPFEACLISLEEELIAIHNSYSIKFNQLEYKYKQLQNPSFSNTTTQDKLKLILQKEEVLDSVKFYRQLKNLEVNKVRYLKGIEIIKILYEKSLSLDHHFTAIAALHDVQQMANPNNYKEFSLVREKLSIKKSKKQGFDLGAILGNNIYTSVIHSMLTLFNKGDISKNDKNEIMNNIECILDFTLEMNNDLKTIYFESVFLKKNSSKTISDIESLFSTYTEPIEYSLSLSDCREKDDWPEIEKKANIYVQRQRFLSESAINSGDAEKMEIDLEFSIERLLQLLYSYNNYINQSAQFYEKFAFMLDNYRERDQCHNKLPDDYIALKESIEITIEKFNNTYKPVELNGSKMKQLLYGVGY